MKGRIIFITATDTGVGKTLLSALLLRHLLDRSADALGMKPFCSGGTGDVRLLRAAQEGKISAAEINPFYFAEPVSPVIAARLHRRRISLHEVLKKIRALQHRCDVLVIEGSGGLLVPLGEDYSVRDVIRGLSCDTIVVSRNKLGTINHTLLTVESLQHAGVKSLKVVLTNAEKPVRKVKKKGSGRAGDVSRASNAGLLQERLGRVPVIELPYLGRKPMRIEAVGKTAKNLKKTLAQIVG